MGLYLGGLIIGRIFVSEIWGAYFLEGLFLGGLIIRILQYIDEQGLLVFVQISVKFPKFWELHLPYVERYDFKLGHFLKSLWGCSFHCCPQILITHSISKLKITMIL